ncbi:RING-box protein 2 [Tupaia chinensis]|uniref:RING-box protein 2 n=1 Tax=Tupaia chinensis TaxID=246437 RepID=UPI0007041CAE|nr:RING-box protein 2 [Tupaia chinensis]
MAEGPGRCGPRPAGGAVARLAAPGSRHSCPPSPTQRLRRRPRAAAMADVEDGEEPCALSSHSGSAGSKAGGDKMFSLKKWNAVAMWSWDVECDTCAICRVQVMDACLRCQAENKQEDCVVVWGECNHSFHNCCMSLWVKQNNRCPLCQQDWVVQRIGK